MAARTHIGTSGWNYAHWRGTFYPDDITKKQWFQYYAERLQSVEINNSFYQLPKENTWTTWYEIAPSGFIYAIKGSRYITHMKKLKEPAEGLERLMSHAKILNKKLGPILFQLPPKWKCNLERLESFLELLPTGQRFAIEFRDETWWNDDVYELLKKYKTAFCIYHLEGRESPREATAPFVYIRLHGPGGKYEGKYDSSALSGWAGAMSQWQAKGHDVYCYFDNDQDGFAAQNAVELNEMLS